MHKLLIFDCDGTLVDTLRDVALCFNQALNENGFPEHPLESYGSFVGGNLEQIIERLLPADSADKENIESVKATYRLLYQNSKKQNTVPYSGIRESLIELRERGYCIAVNTNKGQDLAEKLLDQLFPDHPFEIIVGYREDRPSKPDPYGVYMIIDELGYSIDDSVYIGDGRSDLMTAKNAGIPFIFVEWGQGEASIREEDGVSAVASCPNDLPSVIECMHFS